MKQNLLSMHAREKFISRCTGWSAMLSCADHVFGALLLMSTDELEHQHHHYLHIFQICPQCISIRGHTYPL